MTRQGCCVEPTQDAVNILDRLEGLSKVIPPEIMEQALLETGAGQAKGLQAVAPSHALDRIGDGRADPFTDPPGLQARAADAVGRKDAVAQQPLRGRQRLGVEPVRRVFDLVVRPLATPETPGAFYKGLRLMGIDGTVQDVPDTPANAAHFGRSTGGRGDAAFPQVRKVSLVELGTHVESGHGHRRLARQ